MVPSNPLYGRIDECHGMCLCQPAPGFDAHFAAVFPVDASVAQQQRTMEKAEDEGQRRMRLQRQAEEAARRQAIAKQREREQAAAREAARQQAIAAEQAQRKAAVDEAEEAAARVLRLLDPEAAAKKEAEAAAESAEARRVEQERSRHAFRHACKAYSARRAKQEAAAAVFAAAEARATAYKAKAKAVEAVEADLARERGGWIEEANRLEDEQNAAAAERPLPGQCLRRMPDGERQGACADRQSPEAARCRDISRCYPRMPRSPSAFAVGTLRTCGAALGLKSNSVGRRSCRLRSRYFGQRSMRWQTCLRHSTPSPGKAVFRHVLRHVFRHAFRHLEGKCLHMCLDMCSDMCSDMCLGKCSDMPSTGMVCLDMGLDMCLDMCLFMCLGLCLGIPPTAARRKGLRRTRPTCTRNSNRRSSVRI